MSRSLPGQLLFCKPLTSVPSYHLNLMISFIFHGESDGTYFCRIINLVASLFTFSIFPPLEINLYTTILRPNPPFICWIQLLYPFHGFWANVSVIHLFYPFISNLFTLCTESSLNTFKHEASHLEKKKIFLNPTASPATIYSSSRSFREKVLK